eukprot:Skav206644  [mRNA]  locus=scaffold5599:37431:38255:- [translate_table: standard]
MIRCPQCQIFFGNPCNCCQTVRRIERLVNGRNYLPNYEGRVLTVLRNCAGALTDIAEECVIVKGIGGIPEPPPLDRGSSTLPGQDLSGPELSRFKAEPIERPEGKATKTEDKKEKKKKAKSKEKSVGGEKEKKAKSDSPEEPGDRTRGSGSSTLEVPPPPEENPPGEDGSHHRREARDRDINEEVAENPERFGLGRLSVRGSAARHFNEGISLTPGHTRPNEPLEPPSHLHPRGEDVRSVETRQRSRSREKPKKFKGHKHVQRGKDRREARRRR